MILRQTPVGECDRRICLLTKERGKIAAFARGARRPTGKLAAATNPFSFGRYWLAEGRDSYTVCEAQIQSYFEELRTDYIGACYGMYFAEVADYYTRENNDESQMLKLLYQSLRAVTAPALSRRLVKCVFELKAIAVNGEFSTDPAMALGMGQEKGLEESTRYALHYIAASTVEKLYTFTVNDTVLGQLEQISKAYCRRCMDRDFKTLAVLKTLAATKLT
jgi:DNA repair protein RecO (recombination protein O)